MNNYDTILIFEKPELYFFPHYNDIVFSPYRSNKKTPIYYIYRCLNLLRLPFSSFYWGDWKKHISSAKKVIIFDYGYQNCMEKYILKINSSCKVYLFCWNKIDKYHNNNQKFTLHDNIFSTDKGDCDKYNLKYNHIFYPTEFRREWNPSVADSLYFIGADKGRADKLLAFHRLFKDAGLKSNIRIFSDETSGSYREQYREILTDKSISYPEYIKEILNNGILLDITQNKQRAITMRVLESVVYSKKLITTNAEVRTFPFYNENNILLIDGGKLPSVKAIKDFILKPFIPYTEEQLYEISFEHWLKAF